MQINLLMDLLSHLFKSYHIGLETLVSRSDFIFDSVQLLYYKCHKKNCKRPGSNIDSTDWIKQGKVIINPKSKDNKFFSYAAMH